MLPDVKTLSLSALVALGTLIAMAVAGSVFFASGAIIFPSIVAWVAGSVFAFERRPRHLWLHVAAIGVQGSMLQKQPCGSLTGAADDTREADEHSGQRPEPRPPFLH